MPDSFHISWAVLSLDTVWTRLAISSTKVTRRWPSKHFGRPLFEHEVLEDEPFQKVQLRAAKVMAWLNELYKPLKV